MRIWIYVKEIIETIYKYRNDFILIYIHFSISYATELNVYPQFLTGIKITFKMPCESAERLYINNNAWISEKLNKKILKQNDSWLTTDSALSNEIENCAFHNWN